MWVQTRKVATVSYDHKRILLAASGWVYNPADEAWIKEGIISPIPDTLVGRSSLFNLAGQVKIREYMTAWVTRVGDVDSPVPVT